MTEETVPTNEKIKLLEETIENLKEIIDNKDNELVLNKIKIDRLIENNKQLQSIGNVTEKAAAEYVNEKQRANCQLRDQLTSCIQEQEKLKTHNVHLRDICTQKTKQNTKLLHDVKLLKAKFLALRADYETAKDEPSQNAAKLSIIRERLQSTTLQNRHLRTENNSLVRRFHELHTSYEEKVKILREIADSDDMFNYLRIWLLVCEHKILFYETGHTFDEREEQQLRKKIAGLQQQLKIAETLARTSFIKHRSRMLEEQLTCYTNRTDYSDYYRFAKATLDKFYWILQKGEAVRPVDKEGQLELPWWQSVDEPDARIPFSETVFKRSDDPPGGPVCNIVPGVDVMRPVERRVPVQLSLAQREQLRKTKAENEQLSIELKQTREKLQRATSALLTSNSSISNKAEYTKFIQ